MPGSEVGSLVLLCADGIAKVSSRIFGQRDRSNFLCERYFWCYRKSLKASLAQYFSGLIDTLAISELRFVAEPFRLYL